MRCGCVSDLRCDCANGVVTLAMRVLVMCVLVVLYPGLFWRCLGLCLYWRCSAGAECIGGALRCTGGIPWTVIVLDWLEDCTGVVLGWYWSWPILEWLGTCTGVVL